MRKWLKVWWPGTELNRRRQPFQGCALPPELPGHACSSTTSLAAPNVNVIRRDMEERADEIGTVERLDYSNGIAIRSNGLFENLLLAKMQKHGRITGSRPKAMGSKSHFYLTKEDFLFPRKRMMLL